MSCFSLTAFKILLCLYFFSFIIMCLKMIISFEVILFGFFELLHVYIHVFHQIWGILAIVSTHILSATSSLFSPYETLIMCIFVFFMVSHRLLSLCFLFLFVFENNKCLLIYKHVRMGQRPYVNTKTSISFHGYQKLQEWGKHQESESSK